VVRDISEEYQLPEAEIPAAGNAMRAHGANGTDMLDAALGGTLGGNEVRLGERRSGGASVELLDERMMRLEKSIVSVLSILKKIVAAPPGAPAQHMDNQE
jgi:hypothetical protein